MSGRPYSLDIQEPLGGGDRKRPPWYCTNVACIFGGLLLAMAFTALVLGAWSTDQIKSEANQLYHLTVGQSVVLVDNPGTAISGFAYGGSLFAGTGYWTTEVPLAQQRSQHGVVQWPENGSTIYIFGGVTEHDTTSHNGSDPQPSSTPLLLSSVLKYDTFTGQTTQMADMPEARTRFGYAIQGDRLFVFGGWKDTSLGFSHNNHPAPTVLVYHFTNDTWATADQHIMQIPRVDMAGAALGGKIYAIGGFTYEWASSEQLEVEATNAVEIFDPDTLRWTVGTPLLTARGELRADVQNGTIYAVGGAQLLPPDNTTDCNDRDQMSSCYVFLPNTEAFDPVTNQWVAKANMTRPRGAFAMEALPDGRLFVAGGEYSNGVQSKFAMYHVEEYETVDDVWVEKAPLPQARQWADCAFARGSVYVFGGQPTCELQGGDTPAASLCFNQGLAGVTSYYDVRRPRLYAFVASKGAAGSSRR